MLKQALVLLISSVLALPLWPGAIPLGFVGPTMSAKLAGVQAVEGSTVFAGDSVTVLPGGSLSLMLAGGSRVKFTGDSEARLTREDGRVAISIMSGTAFIATSANSLVEGVLPDVTFRPAETERPSAGWLGHDKQGHAVLYADRGDWLVSIAGDTKPVLLRQGSRMEGTVDASGQGAGQQQSKKKKKMAAFWISAGLAGLGAGLVLAYEHSRIDYCLDPAGPVVCVPPALSPVTP